MRFGKNLFKVSEWDWFKLQLRIHSMEREGKLFVTRYAFLEDPASPLVPRFPEACVQCLFWCKTTDDLIMKKAPRSEHLEFYTTWVSSEEERLRDLLSRLPGMSKEFDLRENIVFTILHNYGMGSLPVCHFCGGQVWWEMDADRIPA